MYYGKQGTLWGVEAPQAFWMIRKILQAYKYFEAAGWDENPVKQLKKFSTRSLEVIIRR